MIWLDKFIQLLSQSNQVLLIGQEIAIRGKFSVGELHFHDHKIVRRSNSELLETIHDNWRPWKRDNASKIVIFRLKLGNVPFNNSFAIIGILLGNLLSYCLSAEIAFN